MEYSLQTMEDVKNFLKTYSGLELESELIKCLTVAICQNISVIFQRRLLVLIYYIISQYKHVHLRPHKAKIGILRRTNNRGCKNPYMLFCADVRKERRIDFQLDQELQASKDNLLPIVNRARSDIPAVTHVDYSARLLPTAPAVPLYCH